MILRKYGIELHSLTVNDLEMIRNWRNENFVRERMFFQEVISFEDQQKWFAQLDETMVYLCIQYQNKFIGLINVKNADWENGHGEAGIFIGVQHYLNSHIPMLAVLCLMDVFFEEFKFSKLIAHVRSDNKSALDFNKELGYTIDIIENDLIELSVDYPSYFKHKAKLNHLLTKLNKGKGNHSFSKEEMNYLFKRK
jgi:UDP-4-amino-4,6-dideoxy-N-acetyl-beta-L-altrosamine N-acetyltransferase